jgi:DNA recombination protein RmuC
METSLIVLFILAGIAIFFGSFLWATRRTLREKKAQIEQLDIEIRAALESKARAEQDAGRLHQVEETLGEIRAENVGLKEQVAKLTTEREANQEKIQWVDRATEALREIFKASASEVLQGNSAEFLKHAREQLDNILNQVRGDWGTHKVELQTLVEPLKTSLEVMDTQIRALEQKREGAYEGLNEKLSQLGQTNQQLQITTATLVQALKSSGTRGRWGEVQLRRVVEMAGMTNHVDFDEQASTDLGRPDMIVHLPNAGVLPVDAKAPMQAYLEAIEASDDNVRKSKLEAHARATRGRITELSQRRYWEQFERTPELVAMFVPNEACLGAAFEYDPDLLEFAIQQRVLITTPVTLIALLKAVAYGWQQHQVTENARQIALQAREMYDRLSTFLGHLADVGTRLDHAVRDYNESIGSLEGRVMPAIRRLREMGVGSEELQAPQDIDRQVRLPAAQDNTSNS